MNRRHFLSVLGAGLFGVVLPSVAHACRRRHQSQCCQSSPLLRGAGARDRLIKASPFVCDNRPGQARFFYDANHTFYVQNEVGDTKPVTWTRYDDDYPTTAVVYVIDWKDSPIGIVAFRSDATVIKWMQDSNLRATWIGQVAPA